MNSPSPWGRALACAAAALTLAATAALPAAADTTPQAHFSYGAILTSLSDASLAQQGGFNLMSAYVAWSAVEPTRGQYLFEQKDQWGRTQANDLTNVIDAARATTACRLACGWIHPPIGPVAPCTSWIQPTSRTTSITR